MFPTGNKIVVFIFLLYFEGYFSPCLVLEILNFTQLPKGFDRFLDKYLVHCKGLTIIKESRYHLPIPSRSRCELFYVQCIMAWSEMASTGHNLQKQLFPVTLLGCHVLYQYIIPS